MYSVCREEFFGHGLSDVVTLECRDVCKDGFGLEGVVDAGLCVCMCGLFSFLENLQTSSNHHVYSQCFLICQVPGKQ